MPKSNRAIIAYVPVLHAGYRRLFNEYPDAPIYVLGSDLIKRFDQLRKELRALSPEDAVAGIHGWGRDAEVLDGAGLEELAKNQPEVIIPDEDVTRELTEGIFTKVSVEPIFLRWDRRKLESKTDPLDPNRTISADELDRELLQQASSIGQKSSNLYRRMGALIVKDGKIIEQAYNASHPTPHTSWIEGDPRNNAHRGMDIDLTLDAHSEAKVIAQAAKRGVPLKGSSLYVVDFPCPTCAKLIANAGISKVYYAQGYAVLDGQQALQAVGVELIHAPDVILDEGDPKSWVPYPEK
jgi:dCMP deaminase